MGLKIVFPLCCCFLFAAEIFLYCSRIPNRMIYLSCKLKGNLIARCFLKTTSGFSGRNFVKKFCCSVVFFEL